MNMATPFCDPHLRSRGNPGSTKALSPARGIGWIGLVGGLAFLLALPGVSPAQVPVSITVDAASTVTSFIPVNVFGVNTAFWRSSAEHEGAQPRAQAAGNYFLRYPAGSADNAHWNGKGTFNSNGYWVPDDTQYQPGFADHVTYLGTTTSYGMASHLTDGSASTTWMSNADTDFPSSQWVYLDLGGNQTVDAVTVAWGNPYATRFTLQYWDPSAPDQWAPYLDSSSHWLDTSAADVAGSGGTQGVTFSPVGTRYVRLLMTASSGPVTDDLGSVTVSGPAYAIAEITLYHGPSQVSVNNADSSIQSKAVASSTDPASSFFWTPSLDFESFMDLVRRYTPSVPPLLSVNMGTGTPQEAAAWVHYANIVKGYGVRYWQIGNEMDGTWEWGGPINARDYVRRYIEFYDAMKAVDPSIIITGPVASNPNVSSNLYDGNSMLQDFISLLHARGKDGYVDALDFHWYPTYQPEPEARVLSTPAQVAGMGASIDGWISGTSVDPDVPVLLSEYNLGATSGLPMLNQWVNGLWLADSLGRFIRTFGPRGLASFFAMIAGGTDTTDSTQGDLGYLQVESGPYQYQERATYWAFRMVASDWAIPADGRPHSLVAADSTQPLLSVYADRRPDHLLSLLVVNKDPSNAYSTALSITGLSAGATAQGLVFDPSHYAWETTSLPYHASPDTPPSPVTLVSASGAFPVTFQPYSLTVLQFTDSAFPTPTFTPIAPTATPTSSFFTSTPVSTLTPSPTPTPTMAGAMGPPLVYPNPLSGRSLNIRTALDSASDVRVKVFTTAFRMVLDRDFPSVPPDRDLSLAASDGTGEPLADGLYYVVVSTDRGRFTSKLLVLR